MEICSWKKLSFHCTFSSNPQMIISHVTRAARAYMLLVKEYMAENKIRLTLLSSPWQMRFLIISNMSSLPQSNVHTHTLMHTHTHTHTHSCTHTRIWHPSTKLWLSLCSFLCLDWPLSFLLDFESNVFIPLIINLGSLQQAYNYGESLFC